MADTSDDVVPANPDLHGLLGLVGAIGVHLLVGTATVLIDRNGLSTAGVGLQAVISGLLATPLLLLTGAVLLRKPRTRPFGVGVLAGALLLGIAGLAINSYINDLMFNG